MPPNIDMWTAVVGVFLPLLIGIVNRYGWPAWAKATGALILCVLAAAGDLYWKGQFDMKNWAQNFLAIFFLVVTTYKGFWSHMPFYKSLEEKTG